MRIFWIVWCLAFMAWDFTYAFNDLAAGKTGRGLFMLACGLIQTECLVYWLSKKEARR